MAKATKTTRTTEAAAAAVPEAKRPAWKEADYTGPLTAPQAAWRNRHIKRIPLNDKRAGEVATK